MQMRGLQLPVLRAFRERVIPATGAYESRHERENVELRQNKLGRLLGLRFLRVLFKS